MSILSLFILIWGVSGVVTGLWSVFTFIPGDDETWLTPVGIFFLAVVLGPIGAIMTLYEELSSRV